MFKPVIDVRCHSGEIALESAELEQAPFHVATIGANRCQGLNCNQHNAF